MDLNADLGELPGEDGVRSDAGLLGVVTTAHIACGGHAGDDESMRRTVAAALGAGVVVGAHPSYPDREGFGRRTLDRSPAQVRADVLAQLVAFGEAAAAEGGSVRSVKPHGALYNRIALDEACAEAVLGAVSEYRRDLVVVVQAGSVALEVAAGLGMVAVAEGFCDRAYRADGSLVARSVDGAVITDPAIAAARAVAIAATGTVPTLDGVPLALSCATLCVHGDAPGALVLARAVRRALEEAGVALAPFAGP